MVKGIAAFVGISNLNNKNRIRLRGSIQGIVKYFNKQRGFGFIERYDEEKDVFVPISPVIDA